jgi:hypothetical protein
MEVPARRPQVLVLDFADLSRVPEGQIPMLLELTGAGRAIITYRFAQRSLVTKHAASERIRLLQGPVSRNLLRAHILLSALDDTLPPRRSAGNIPVTGSTPVTGDTPVSPTPLPVPVTKPARYTPEQQGRLMEISSAVQCECPNHLAQIVTGLQAFESYSRQCENRNGQDREIHGLLYRQTAAARAVMEEALAALVKHERIQR